MQDSEVGNGQAMHLFVVRDVFGPSRRWCLCSCLIFLSHAWRCEAGCGEVKADGPRPRGRQRSLEWSH